MKHSTKKFLMFGMIFGLSMFAHLVGAQNVPLDSLLQMRGVIYSTGTDFVITDSDYLNISLHTTNSVDIEMASVPRAISIVTLSTSTVATTTFTISGLLPNTTYYRYTDGLMNLEQFVSNQDGSYIFNLDISRPHDIAIQAVHSTRFIGGVDGGDCSSIGNWNMNTRTCTLTTDVYESIEITSNGVTLDGGGHAITGIFNNYSYMYGVYIGSGISAVTVKNLNISNFIVGIENWSSNSTFENNMISKTTFRGVTTYYVTGNLFANNSFSNNVGVAEIYLMNSWGNVLRNNRFSYGRTSIRLENSSQNIIKDNTITYANGTGILLRYSSVENVITDNTVSNAGSSPVFFVLIADSSNKIYNNNFTNNWGDTNNGSAIFSMPLPAGGNYWGPCVDANNDGICDSPRNLSDGSGGVVGIDQYPWAQKDGWKISHNALPTISNLNQYKSDSITPISNASTTTEDMVVFGATLNSSSVNPLQLQIEASSTEVTTVFTASSTSVSPNTFTTTSLTGLPEGSYHWHARTIDIVTNSASAWVNFGDGSNPDFVVRLPLAYKAANLAKELINQPYLWGGKGWDYNQGQFAEASIIKSGYHFWNSALNNGSGDVGFGTGVDCSGLVLWAYDWSFDPLKSRLNNIVKAEGADEQYRYNTTPVTEQQLQPGDLMFFDWNSDGFIDHVAMYVGNNGGYDVVSAKNIDLGIVRASKDILQKEPGFVAFKRVIPSVSLAMSATSHSPVNLVVTDPDGFTITPTTTIISDEEHLREIPGVLYYSEIERGADGRPIDQVYSYAAKNGDYIIKVLPDLSATPTSTYTLDFFVGNQSVTLAQDVQISQIPTNGYGVVTSATGTVSSFIPVSIDIKPGSYPNSINLGSNGVVPVAILGSATLDVHQINPTTIKLANASIKLKGNGQPMASYSDMNGDGFADMVVQVSTQALQLTSTDVIANLDGQLMNGIAIKGSESIRIVP